MIGKCIRHTCVNSSEPGRRPTPLKKCLHYSFNRLRQKIHGIDSPKRTAQGMDQTSKAKGQKGRPPQAGARNRPGDALGDVLHPQQGDPQVPLDTYNEGEVESWIESLDYDRVLPILAVVKEDTETERIVAGPPSPSRRSKPSNTRPSSA